MSADSPGSAVLPLLRAGQWYESHDTEPVPGYGTTGPRLSLAPKILIRDDARRLRDRLPALPPLDPQTRVDLLSRAVDLFCDGHVTVTGWGRQGPAEFSAAMLCTTGLPGALVRRWSAMLREHLKELAASADGAVDETALALVSLPANTFTCLESVLEAALTSGAVWIRPSRREPVSSARLVGALIDAGWPPERLGYYPTDPGGLTALIQVTTRQTVYGGDGLAAAAARSDSLDLRGPGRACAIVDAHALADPARTARRIAPLVAADSGRFCSNVCTIVCLGDAGPLVGALGDLLDGISLDPPDHRWPVAHCTVDDGRRTAALIEDGLAAGGRIATQRRLPIVAGETAFLPPTLLHVGDVGHPLIGCELPFPFAVATTADDAGAQSVAERAHFVYTAPFLTHEKGGPR